MWASAYTPPMAPLAVPKSLGPRKLEVVVTFFVSIDTTVFDDGGGCASGCVGDRFLLTREVGSTGGVDLSTSVQWAWRQGNLFDEGLKVLNAGRDVVYIGDRGEPLEEARRNDCVVESEVAGRFEQVAEKSESVSCQTAIAAGRHCVLVVNTQHGGGDPLFTHNRSVFKGKSLQECRRLLQVQSLCVGLGGSYSDRWWPVRLNSDDGTPK